MTAKEAFSDGELNAMSDRVVGMMRRGDFGRARPLIRQLLRHVPGDPFVNCWLAVTYAETSQVRKAVGILLDYIRTYGEHYEVSFCLGETYAQSGEYDLAEEALRKSLALTPRDLARERSHCLNSLGVTLWEMHKRENALEAWKEALSIDPRNKVARKNLADFTNIYNEAKAPSPVFDDVYHFQKIQSDRYLKSMGRTQFTSMREANRVLGNIMQAWNAHIAPLREKLDAMTAAEKTMRFSDVTVDFKAPVSKDIFDVQGKGPRGRESRTDVKTKMSDMLRMLDSNVPFLPPGGGITLIFGVPLLAAVGVEEDRLKSIVKGGEASGAEQRIFSWAYDVVTAVLPALDEHGKVDEPRQLKKAMGIARKRLPWEVAEVAVLEVAHLMTLDPEELFTELGGVKTPKKRRRKKSG